MDACMRGHARISVRQNSIFSQGTRTADLTQQGEQRELGREALDHGQAQGQDSQLFNEEVPSHRVPEASPPSWLAFSLFSFSVG